MKLAGLMPHDTTSARRDVFLSKASSRKELARTIHELVLPTLANDGNNLLFLKKKIEALEDRVSALEKELSNGRSHDRDDDIRTAAGGTD